MYSFWADDGYPDRLTHQGDCRSHGAVANGITGHPFVGLLGRSLMKSLTALTMSFTSNQNVRLPKGTHTWGPLRPKLMRLKFTVLVEFAAEDALPSHGGRIEALGSTLHLKKPPHSDDEITG